VLLGNGANGHSWCLLSPACLSSHLPAGAAWASSIIFEQASVLFLKNRQKLTGMVEQKSRTAVRVSAFSH